MRKYYIGPLKRATAINAKKNSEKKIFEYDLNVETIDEKVVFYENFFSVIINASNKEPMILEEELDDHFQYNFKYNNNSDKECSFDFVNYDELKQVNDNCRYAFEKPKRFIKRRK